MTEEQKPNDDNQNQRIRNDLVNTAVNFFLNPSVINKPYEHKVVFLRKKGLTDAEISLAYDRAEKDPKYKQIQQSNVSNFAPVLPPPVPVYRPLSFWSQLSRFSSSLIVLGVAVFGAHYVYKKYIEPLIFGESKDSKAEMLEKHLMDMTNSLCQLERHVSSLEESISFQKEQMDKFIQNEVNEYCPTPLALRELKTEIASVKSLLLNRHQFPALPKVSPTIPHWQLPSSESDNDISKQNDQASEQHNNQSEFSFENEHSASKQDHEFVIASDDSVNLSNGTDSITTEVESMQQNFEELSSESPAV